MRSFRSWSAAAGAALVLGIGKAVGWTTAHEDGRRRYAAAAGGADGRPGPAATAPGLVRSSGDLREAFARGCDHLRQHLSHRRSGPGLGLRGLSRGVRPHECSRDHDRARTARGAREPRLRRVLQRRSSRRRHRWIRPLLGRRPRQGGSEQPDYPTPLLGTSSNVVVGEPVAAIGSPFGNENSLGRRRLGDAAFDLVRDIGVRPDRRDPDRRRHQPRHWAAAKRTGGGA